MTRGMAKKRTSRRQYTVNPQYTAITRLSPCGEQNPYVATDDDTEYKSSTITLQFSNKHIKLLHATFSCYGFI